MHPLRFGLICLALACTSEQSAKDAPSAAGSGANTVEAQHFFSVAWGCVQVEKAKLDAAAYTIRDYQVESGPCPAQITVVTSQASPLLSCAITIGPPAIPGTYILYDKRSLDGKTVSDLRQEGFSKENFCPMLAQKKFQ